MSRCDPHNTIQNVTPHNPKSRRRNGRDGACQGYTDNKRFSKDGKVIPDKTFLPEEIFSLTTP